MSQKEQYCQDEIFFNVLLWILHIARMICFVRHTTLCGVKQRGKGERGGGGGLVLLPRILKEEDEDEDV
jgi:hypothetical protein